MGTCTKCGRELADNDLIYWKCTKCGKIFTASLLKLKNLWKQKRGQSRQALLKCPGCSVLLDNGNEMLVYKCPGCDAAWRGNLEGIVSERERDLDDINSSVQHEYTEKNLDINKLTGVEFEKLCQQLVENMGFETELTKASGDGGIDLIAYNYQPLLSGKYIIQCKRYSGSVGEPIIRDLYGVVMSERANKGVLMTTGYFTKSAIAFAEGKPIELIDGSKLNDLLNSYRIMIDIEGTNNRTVKDIFLNNSSLYFQYEEYINTIKNLTLLMMKKNVLNLLIG